MTTGSIPVEVRVKGLRLVKLVMALALFAHRLRLISVERAVDWAAWATARCRAQVRMGGGKWTGPIPIDPKTGMPQAGIYPTGGKP
jgi:hypothetical protein